MISIDNALRLQAWVDGELGWFAARRVSRWVATDGQARALAEELRATRCLLGGNELPRTLPESREFYWSGISRGLEGVQAAPDERVEPGEGFAWRRWLIPAGSVAMLVMLVLGLKFGFWFGGGTAMVAVGHELETPIAGISSFAFRSETEHMTVVWLTFED